MTTIITFRSKFHFTSCILILSAMLFSACAIHQPMSEMVMYAEKEVQDGSFYHASYSHSFLTAAFDLYPESAVINEYYRRNPDQDSSRRDPGVLSGSYSTNLIFLSERVDWLGFSISLPYLGIDYTARLGNDIYFTNAFSLVETENALQVKTILQRRLLKGNPFGLSAGLTFSSKRIAVTLPGGVVVPNVDTINTQSVGIRTTFMLSPVAVRENMSKPFFYSSLSVNYDFGLNIIYPRIAASFGLY